MNTKVVSLRRDSSFRLSFLAKRSLALAFVIVSAVSPAFAVDRAWINSGTDFNTSANWVATNPGVADRAIFSNISVSPVMNTNTTISGLTFYTTGSLSGSGTLTLTSSIDNNQYQSAISMMMPGTATIANALVTGTTNYFTSGFGATLNITGNISGTFNIRKTDFGTLTLSGNNSGFSGTLNANGGNGYFGVGRVNLNSDTALGTGVLVVGQGNGGSQMGNTSGILHTLNNNVVLDTSGNSNWYLGNGGNLTFTGSTMYTTGTVTASVGVWGGTLTLQGGITTGTSGGLTKTGDGTLVLGGNNTYTGTTTINGGMLVLDKSGAGSAFSSFITTLTDGGFTLKGASTGSTTQNITGGGATLTFNRATDLVVNANGGTSTLTVQNTWNRATGGSAGTLEIVLTDSNSFLAATPGMLNGVVATSNVAFATVTDFTGSTGFAAVSGGNVVRYTGASTLAASGNSNITNYATSGIALAGTGTVNTLQVDGGGGTGILDLNSGTLSFTARGLLMTGSNNFTVQNGQLGASNVELAVHQYGSGTMFVNSTIGGMTKAGRGTVVISSTNNTGGVQVNEGNLIVTGRLSTSGLTVNGGMANLQNASAISGGANSVQGTGVLNANVTNAISGNASLSINGLKSMEGGGGAVVNLNAANNYTGNTTVAQGTLNIGHAGALGSGTLVLNQGNLDNISGGTLTLSTNNPIELQDSFTFRGSNALNLGTGNANITQGGASTTNRNIIVTSSTLTIGGGVTRSGAGAGLVTLTKAGAGTLVINGVSTYDGGTLVEGGMLVANNTAAISSGSLRLINAVLGLGAGDMTRALGTGANQIAITSGGGFAAFGANRIVNLGGAGAALTWNTTNFLTGGGGNGSTTPLILGADTATHTVDFQNALILGTSGTSFRVIQVNNGAAKVDGKISGVISGSGANQSHGFEKIGNGTLELTAVNTYNGPTAIVAGTLLVSGNGAINGSAVTVGRGATFSYTSSVNRTGANTWVQGSTLGGTNWNGTLDNAVVSAVGGGPTYITPGNSPGTANTGSQTWGSGGTYVWEINDFTPGGAGTTWDLVNLSSSLNITSTSLDKFNIFVTSLNGDSAGNAANFNDLSNYQLLIADAGSAITTFNASLFNVDATTAFTNPYTGTWSIVRGDNVGVTGGDDSQLYLLYNAVPEPSTLALIGLGAIMALARRRRQA